ncbi:MAG: CopG family transcriptional regulator [Syntrophorhabdus sp.]|nr:CopG family transcriptional regulator [Syntrophorhabdus sp.]
MEKRFGAILILLTNKTSVPRVNTLLTEHSEIILGRQGIPIRDHGINIISLVIEGDTDRINALTGKIGKLEGVEVRSILTKYREQ